MCQMIYTTQILNNKHSLCCFVCILSTHLPSLLQLTALLNVLLQQKKALAFTAKLLLWVEVGVGKPWTFRKTICGVFLDFSLSETEILSYQLPLHTA